jgi:phosphate starvation-inducible protein PhoH and related proteins
LVFHPALGGDWPRALRFDETSRTRLDPSPLHALRYSKRFAIPHTEALRPPNLMKQTVRIAGGINELFGTLDGNLKFFESALQVTTQLRDRDLEIEGAPAHVERAAKIVGEYNQRIREGRIPDSEEVKALLRVATEEPASSLRGAFSPDRTRSLGKKSVAPKSVNQRRYIEALETYDMVFAIGPGGTGKTYLGVAMAVSALLSKQVNRIILARPAVEAGERLGFLPGTIQEKVDPYMRPLYDALHDLLEADKLERFLEKGIIEIAPLAFMRGRTLNDSFVILDEAQNTTTEQMKMFLTRLGFNSKAVITGDVTQIDLPNDRRSGLIEAIEVVGKIEGISLIYFDERDVVRHSLVQRIIKAYDEYDAGHPGAGSRSSNSTGNSRNKNHRD